MDSTENGLTSCRELAQESDHVECGLTVLQRLNSDDQTNGLDTNSGCTHQTGCRLVQEEKKLGPGCEFYTDGETLPGLDTETKSGNTNHCIGQVLEFEKFEDLFDIL